MGNGILSVRATLNGSAVPEGTAFTLTYYLNGEPVTQAITATTATTPPVNPETPETDKPNTDVPTGEIAYTGGALAPALWIGGGVLLALLGGIAIFLIRRRADLNSVVESSEDTTETPAEEQ
ncbi:hypothetical protein [uncultured Microbacterium sp.]|uniref:hypothetical protein n=1 Tax=uncultured Microbacterium sp. TaxID=191216 RepID=UPI002619634B|nr:hypothetical protein [uncultured Microbacterium sp.]